MKKNIVFLTGAGMSAESGISTFRDSNGLWENHAIENVATPEAFVRNPKIVLDFYNARRKQLFEVEPNQGHQLIAKLENDFQVAVITQNVDDLHERAGSSQVLHLHGELRKVRSTFNPSLIYHWEEDLNLGDKCEKDSQLRPHIVWFGEEVPAMSEAIEIVLRADFVVIIGTSLQVYPAAGLMNYTKQNSPILYIDPKPSIFSDNRITIIPKTASEGMEELIEKHL